MQAIEALLQRHSARALGEPAPDDAALALMFQSAAHAPDHGRLRPWRFILIRHDARGQLGELLAEHLRRTRQPISEEALERERQKAFRAPVIIAVAAIIALNAKVPPIEQVLSAGAAAYGLMLAAFSLGFNAMWKTGGPAYDETVKSALGLAQKDALVGFLYVGTEERSAQPPARPAWQQFVQEWQRPG